MRVRLKHHNLAQALARSRLSLNGWARKLGLSSGHLSELANGKKPYPTARTRRRLLEGLGLQFDDLFELDSAPAAPRRASTKPNVSPSSAMSRTRVDFDRPAIANEAPTMLWLNDLFYAFRRLLRRPGFTAAAVLTVAIGIASNTAMFGIVHSILWRAYPYGEPERLVRVFRTDVERGRDQGNLAYPDFLDYRSGVSSSLIDDMAVTDWEPYSLAVDEQAFRIGGGRVSFNLFRVLGVSPMFGRDFVEGDDQPGAERVALVDETLWKNQFGSDPAIVGRQILLNGTSHSVIGVIPAESAFPEGAKLWVPLRLERDYRRGSHWLQSVARLAEGATTDGAAAAFEPIASRLAQEYPDSKEGQGIRVQSLRESRVEDFRAISMTLLGVVGFVMLLVCANVAHLLLARGLTRSHEFVVRRALGASRMRLVRELSSESLILAGLGCVAGVTAGHLAARSLARLAEVEVPAWIRFDLHPTVVIYAVSVSVVAVVLFGLFPAFSTVSRSLAASSAIRTRAPRSRLRGSLVAAEVAVSLVLLVGAGLMIQSLLRMSRVDPGFATNDRLTVGLDLLSHTSRSPMERSRLVERYRERLQAVPGVVSVAVVDRLPLKPASNSAGYTIEGQTEEQRRRNPEALYARVSTDYFRAMGIPMMSGSSFPPWQPISAASDSPVDADTLRRVIVSSQLAAHFWPEGSAVGKRLKFGGPDADRPWYEITAVVGDVRHFGLDRELDPHLYVPFQENPVVRMTWVLHTAVAPESIITSVQEAVRELDPHQPLHEVMTVGEVMNRSMWMWRFFGRLFWMFAVVALVLASIGIYGVMSYTVTHRVPELGIRAALGAKRSQLLGMIFRDGGKPIAVGIAIGFPLAFALTQIMKSFLFGLSGFEPLPLLAVGLFMVAVSLVAMAVPATRAASVDPTIALRHD